MAASIVGVTVALVKPIPQPLHAQEKAPAEAGA